MVISIITTTYNSASTLSATLASLLQQTHHNLECVIVDGASNDNTLDIIKEHEPRFEGRLKMISEPDNGLYDAMNKGLRRATGDIVGILNSDDYFTSNDVLERIAKAFEEDETLEAVYGDVHFINDGEPDKCVRYYSSRSFRPWMLRFGLMPAHPSFYVRRSVYEKYGLYFLDYKIASDYDMMVRLLWKNKIKTKYIDMDFVTMRTGGISTKNIHNRWLITKEDVTACKRNGLWTCTALICLKYLKKVFEFR